MVEESIIRSGFGVDFHALEAGRKLILGGVEIDHSKGLKGHSDADVLTHAICDALLGAAGLGDLGTHFPSTDDRYKNIYSLKLLKEVRKMIDELQYKVNNIDSTVVAQKPKLLPYRERMEDNISKCLDISNRQVNVKATTSEGLGPWGREEGIAAYCSATIRDI